MAKKNEYSGAEKLAILEELKAGGGTLVEAAHKYNLHKKTLRTWRHQYELYGMEGLEIRVRNNRYLEMKKLEYENERRRAENAFLKKWKEMQRGRV